MYTMKEVCTQVGMSYETLKFYCNEGLIPNIQRDKNNYRIFDERNINWIKSLQCLRKTGMSIKTMKEYLSYCLEGSSSILQRKAMLDIQKKILLKQLEEINESIEFIDKKQQYFDDILDGKIEYTSNLIDIKH